VTLDDFDYFTLAEEDPKGLVGSTKKLIIDEVQRVPKLTVAVKYAIDELNAQIVLSGSSRIGLLDSTADSLAGRIHIIDLPTTCWGEELGSPNHKIFDPDSHDPLVIKEGQRQLEGALRFGGFPEVAVAAKPDQKHSILKNYRDTYFTRDLAQLSNLENISGLMAILTHYGLSIGSLTQISHFRNESGLSHPTAKKYVQVIYQSSLGFQLLGYQYGPAKRYLKAAKSYFSDNGMITALNLQCSQGQILENFVISELEKRRKLGFINSDQFFYYNSAGGAEIDLVFEQEEFIYAIEIKSTKKPQKKDIRSLKDFVSQGPKKRKGFLFYTGEKFLDMDGISCIPVAAIYRGC
jgi:hypothetical protein